MNNCIILRSSSGAGKTTFANYVKGLNFNADIRVCTADDYFYQDGEYKFNPAKLGEAHSVCQKAFLAALNDKVDVVVANTSTTRKERDYYVKLAKENGYRVFSLVVENLGTKNVHAVPNEVLERQKNNLKNNIDL